MREAPGTGGSGVEGGGLGYGGRQCYPCVRVGEMWDGGGGEGLEKGDVCASRAERDHRRRLTTFHFGKSFFPAPIQLRSHLGLLPACSLNVNSLQLIYVALAHVWREE